MARGKHRFSIWRKDDRIGSSFWEGKYFLLRLNTPYFDGIITAANDVSAIRAEINIGNALRVSIKRRQFFFLMYFP